jgi:ABC-type oligopeptide transport system ATPase subunit
MVNIESNPLNGSSFMNDLRNKYMEKQTAVEWIVSKLSITFQTMYSEEIEQAKEMENEQKGYTEEQAKQIWKAGQEYWKTSGSSITFEELTETFNTKEKCLSCGNEKQDYVLYCEFCRQEI